MDIGLQKLKKLYFLEPKKVDEIAERIIRNDTLGITTAKSPHVVILGGQPGSVSILGRGFFDFALVKDIATNRSNKRCNTEDQNVANDRYVTGC